MPEPEQWEVPTGSGALLSEQPYVDEMVRKEHFKSPLLSKIHRLMYNRAGVMKKIKSSILSFSGIPDLDDDARERLAQRVGKLSMELLKRIMDTLGVNRSSLSFEDKKASKENLVARLVEWLEKPTETTQKPPSAKKKRSSTKKKPAAKKKRAAGGAAKTAKSRPTKKARKIVVDEDEGAASVPAGMLGRAERIVRSVNVDEISMRAIYEQLQKEFGCTLEKPQKKVIKSLVLDVVAEENDS